MPRAGERAPGRRLQWPDANESGFRRRRWPAKVYLASHLCPSMNALATAGGEYEYSPPGSLQACGCRPESEPCRTSSPSTRAPRARARSSSITMRPSSPSDSASFDRSSRVRAGLNTTPARSGRRRFRWRPRRSGARTFGRETSPPSASPTSARPPSCGIARPESPSTTRSSGRTAGRQISAIA